MVLPLRKPLLEEFEKEKIKPITIGSYWLREGEFRLDASFYNKERFNAYRVLKEGKYQIKTIGELAEDIFNPPPIKRIFTDDSKIGTPYILPSELNFFRLRPRKYVLANKMPDIDDWFVRENWIVLTQSGNVGIPIFITEKLTHAVISQNAIRVVPKEAKYSGYIYAYLSTWIGHALLIKDQYGATVTHLDPHHVASVPIPITSSMAMEKIHDAIVMAYQVRNEANEILDKAENLFYKELEITPFSQDDVKYISNDKRIRAFTIGTNELNERFDVSYHIPVIKTVIRNLRNGKYPLVRLGNIAEKIFIPPRFKRIYVGKEYGIPFLRPSHIPLIKPYDLGYISRPSTSVIKQLMLVVGDIMVTTDGTVGRIGIVSGELDGWAGSNNIGRITYSPDDNRNGYLALFLMTAHGHYQLTREIYGGIIDHLEVPHLASVWIPDAPRKIQSRIGSLVIQAFQKKEEANKIEENAIKELESLMFK